jgi:hypothetical protein
MSGALAALAGAGGFAVSLTDTTVSNSSDGTGAITASYVVGSNGKTRDQAGTVLEQWLLSGAALSYEVRATFVSGDALTSGTTGTWLPLTADQTWTRTCPNNQDKTSIFLIEIRDAATTTVRDSATITLALDNYSGGGGTL